MLSRDGNAKYRGVERGKGPLLWDVDGNSYIDLLYNYTSLVHGHAYPRIVSAIEANVGRGSVWPAGSRDQIELAELICGRIPSIERVRFCNSGTEAGMLAAKVARAVTGRPLILKADIGYHGSYDDLENPQTPLDKQRTVIAEFGNAESFERLLRESGDKVAAVFLEAVVGAGGIIAGSPDFLHRVEAATKKVGAVFVLDEVITLRLAVGGAQSKYGLNPDLTMLGKIIGGGLPVGAVGGSKAIMDYFDPYRGPKVSHSGTFNGNVLTCVAGKVALEELTEDRIARMDQQAVILSEALESAAADYLLSAHVRHEGSLLQVAVRGFGAQVQNAQLADELTQKFHLACLNSGVFIAPRGMLALATVISDEVLDEAAGRIRNAVARLAQEMKASVPSMVPASGVN
jgi:glutamate-1-semialdehyde 2,1-aminomutase